MSGNYEGTVHLGSGGSHVISRPNGGSTTHYIGTGTSVTTPGSGTSKRKGNRKSRKSRKARKANKANRKSRKARKSRKSRK